MSSVETNRSEADMAVYDYATQLLPLAAKQGSTTVRGNEIVESLVTGGSFNFAVKTIVLLAEARVKSVV